MMPEKKEKGKGKKKEEKKEEEGTLFTIPLTDALSSARRRRSSKAIRTIKKFIERHMKPERIVLTEEVNEAIWARGMKRPPRSIQVRATKDEEGVVTVSLG